jgi:hypothetical protein
MDTPPVKLQRPHRLRRYITRVVAGLVLLCILATGLSVLSNALLPAHSQLTERLSELDKARLAEIFHLQRELGDTLWPGWGQANIPVILYNEEYAFLMMYPDPPPGWLKVPHRIKHGGPWEPVSRDTFEGQVYYRQRLPGPDITPEAFTVLVGERWVASLATKEWSKIDLGNQIHKDLPPLLKQVFPYRLVARLLLWVIGSDGYICSVLHESFHAYEGMKAPSRLADAETAVSLLDSRYPWNDQAFNNDWRKELDLLAEALQVKSYVETKERVLQFLTQRQERRTAYGLKTDLIDLERQREWEEGLAKYTELAIWRLAATTPGYQPVPSVSADPDFKHYTTFEKRWSQELAQIRRERHAQDGRFYYTGMAQAFLLDRVMPDWKTKVMAEGWFLEDLLREAVQ